MKYTNAEPRPSVWFLISASSGPQNTAFAQKFGRLARNYGGNPCNTGFPAAEQRAASGPPLCLFGRSALQHQFLCGTVVAG